MSEDDLSSAVPQLDERSVRALRAAEEWIGDDVQGVAIGSTGEGEPCVVVYALAPESERVRQLPSECEGLPVRVETGDAFEAGG